MSPWRQTLSLCFILSACLVASAKSWADVVSIPVGQQAAQDLALPARGTPAAQVLQHFGEPHSREAPVGSPPITRWHYAEFTVIFESDTVVASVATFVPQVQPAQSNTDSASYQSQTVE